MPDEKPTPRSRPSKGAQKDGPIKQGLQKGAPERLPRGAMVAGPTQDGCRNCVIRALNNVPFPPRTTTATAFVADNAPPYVITASPNPPACPCTWSNEIYIEYVAVLTGAAGRLKRKNMQFPQVLERIKLNPRDPQNPYVTIAGCTLTIDIAALNTDLRAGINTQHAFFQGVVTQLKLGVKCNGTYRTILINVTDP
jgi:hypothetical protein